MKNRFVAVGTFGFALLLAQACSSDDEGPITSAAGNSGSATGGTANGGGATAGSTSGGSASGGSASGSNSGGTSSGGTATAGSAGSSGSSAGGTTSSGGEAGSGGVSSAGEGGMGGALEGAGGAGGADSGDETVTLSPTTCNYTEVESDTSQDSGLDARSGHLKVICGKIDVGDYNAGSKLLDRDTYVIDVGDDDLLRLELPSFKGLTEIQVTLDNQTTIITQPVSVFHLSTFGDSVILRIDAFSAADLPMAIPYQISVVSDDAVDTRCAAKQGAATFTEAGDGANNRGNDVYHFDDSVASLTPAADSAEATGITLDHASYRVNGVSADVTRLGDYEDGDSYAFHTGPTTTQVTLRADWTGSRNMDVFVLKAGSAATAGFTAKFSNTSPEYATVYVKPNTDYVAYAGAFAGDLPFNYALTMCGETYAFNGP